MNVEIELKFIALPEAIKTLPDFLSLMGSQLPREQHLKNIYFDTADRLLREHDIGLRIRQFNDYTEMTLKGQGTVIAGLHQRTEYNVQLPGSELDLTLLPEQAFPAGLDLTELQNSLLPLFSTHFDRQTWMVNFQQSEIEVALDRGEVKAGNRVEAINEIELELKQGNQADLLAFAESLGTLGHIRLGGESKAARGYRLLKEGHKPNDSKALSVLVVPRKSTVEQGLQSCLHHALLYWQYHEELCLRDSSKGVKEIKIALAMIRQIWLIFGGDIPRKATAELREKLSTLEQLFAQGNAISDVVYHPIYLQTKMCLVTWLLNQQWRLFIKDKEQKKLADSFKRFADIMLGRFGAEIKEAFSYQLSDIEYQDQLPRLQRAVLSLYLLSGAYAHQSYDYIQAWEALLLAIQNHLSVKHLDDLCEQALDQPVFWLNGASAKGAN